MSNTEIRSPIVQEVKEAMLQLLHQYPETAKAILERISFNEKLRKETCSGQKRSKRKAKENLFQNPQIERLQISL